MHHMSLQDKIHQTIQDLRGSNNQPLEAGELSAYQQLKTFDELLAAWPRSQESKMFDNKVILADLDLQGQFAQSLSDLAADISVVKSRVFAIGTARESVRTPLQIIVASDDEMTQADKLFFDATKDFFLEIQNCHMMAASMSLAEGEAQYSRTCDVLSRSPVKSYLDLPDVSTGSGDTIEGDMLLELLPVIFMRCGEHLSERIGDGRRAIQLLLCNLQEHHDTAYGKIASHVISKCSKIRYILDECLEDIEDAGPLIECWTELARWFHEPSVQSLIDMGNVSPNKYHSRLISRFEDIFLTHKAISNIYRIAKLQVFLPGLQYQYIEACTRIIQSKDEVRRKVHSEMQVAWVLKRIEDRGSFPLSVVRQVACSRRPCFCCAMILASMWPGAKMSKEVSSHCRGLIFPPLRAFEAQQFSARITVEIYKVRGDSERERRMRYFNSTFEKTKSIPGFGYRVLEEAGRSTVPENLNKTGVEQAEEICRILNVTHENVESSSKVE